MGELQLQGLKSKIALCSLHKKAASAPPPLSHSQNHAAWTVFALFPTRNFSGSIVTLFVVLCVL